MCNKHLHFWWLQNLRLTAHLKYVYFRSGYKLNRLSCSISNSQTLIKNLFLVIDCIKETNNDMIRATKKITSLHPTNNDATFKRRKRKKHKEPRTVAKDLWHCWNTYKLNWSCTFLSAFLFKIISQSNFAIGEIDNYYLKFLANVTYEIFRVCHLTLLATLPYTPL